MNLYCGTSINPDTILSHNLIITVFFIFVLRLLDEFYILKRLVLSTVLKVVICRFIWRWIMSKLVDTKKIGEGIKKLRIKRNLTQEFLASSVGYSTRSIRRIETQGTDSINVVNTFAEFFGVSALDILDGCLFFIKIDLCFLLFKRTFQIKKALTAFAIHYLP